MQRKPGQKSNALAFPDLGHPAGRMQQAEKTLGEPGLTSFPISAIIETCPSPTRCWLPAPPTASPPWVRSLVSGFFVSSSLPTRPARSEEHTSELQSRFDLVCRPPLE